MIVYNLWKYLEAQLPTLNYCIDAFEGTSSADAILLTETPGLPDHYNVRQELTIQILSRSFEKPVAKANINDIFLLLKNRFRLVLPEVMISGVLIPAVNTAQISPLQTPGHIGVDDNKHHLYSFNIKIVIGG